MAAGELEGGDLPRSVLADADRPAEKMAHVQLAGGKVGGCPDANPDHVREDKSKGGSMSRTGWIGAVLVAALPGLEVVIHIEPVDERESWEPEMLKQLGEAAEPETRP